MERKDINGVEVRRDHEGRWVDTTGVEYALVDESSETDPVARCGIAPLALPVSDQWTDACLSHDFAYNSPTYQRSHAREEADAKLEADLVLVSRSRLRRLLAPVAAGVARLFGGLFWENKKTRWK